MIKANVRNKDGDVEVIILGLSRENTTRLHKGDPVDFDLGELLDVDDRLRCVIIAGETEADIRGTLAPMLGPDTVERFSGGFGR